MLESEEVQGASSDPTATATANTSNGSKCGSNNMVDNSNFDEADNRKSPSNAVENGSVDTQINGVASSEANGFKEESSSVNGFSTSSNSSISSSGSGTWTPQPFATPFIPQFLSAAKGPNGSVGGQSPKHPPQRFSPGPRDSRGGTPASNPPPLQSVSATNSPAEPAAISPTGGQQQQQHVVLLHVNPGETISIQMGTEIQLIQGPATVRMVSNSNTPPIPMPVQVPPGHMVQQIVDENGTLRHVILSAQPQMPVPMGRPTYGPGPPPPPNAPPSPTYYPYHPPPYTTHNQFHPRHPLGIAPAHLTPHPLHQHPGPPPPPPTAPHNHTHPCNNHQHQGPSPPPLHSLHMDDRTQRQLQKMKRRLDARQRDVSHLINSRYSPPSTPKKETTTNSKKYKDRNTSTSGLEGTDDHHLQEEEAALLELLSSMCVPQVSQVTSNSALIKWQPPKMWLDNSGEGEKCAEFDIKESEFSYELLLSDRGREGKYRVVCSQEKVDFCLTDLKPATEYYICVLALLDSLRGQPSESILLRTSCCEPETPSPPKFVSRTKSSLTLRWNAVADNGSKVTAFILEFDEGKEGDQFKEIFNGLQKQFKITKLLASTCYRFRLAAANEIGRSEFCAPVRYSTSGGAPSQPLPPRLVEAGVDTVSLAWQMWPSDDLCVLQMEDPSTGHGFLPSYNGSESSYCCTSLKRCQEYKFRLCIKNEEGSSPWSDVVSFHTKPDRPTPPGRPSTKGRIHPYSFKAVWDPPKDNGGADISAYNLELDSGSGFTSVYRGLDLEFNCDRLNPGHNYQLRVSCEGPGGRSEYSEIGFVMTAAVVPGQCSPPRLHGKPKAISLHIKWNPPAEDGGSSITEYEADVTNPDGSNRVVYRGRETDCMVAGLMPGRNYLFRVCAYNKIGRGPWSEHLEAVSSAGPPEPPSGLEVICRSPHCLVASWKEPVGNGAPVSEYRLEWCQKDGDFSLLYSGSGSSYEVSKGLTPATLFVFRVQAANVAGVGQFCEAVQITTPSSSPSPISLSSVRASCSPFTIHLSWQPPDCHGSDIIAYNIDLGEKHDQVTVEGGVCEHLLEGLQPETTYRVRIQAVNGVGVGPFSSAMKVTTKALPPPAPRLECVGVSHNSLRLKWGDGKNIDFTRYTLEMGTRSGAFTIVYHGTALTYKVPKLSETTDYHFRIFGSNDAGEGPHSTVHVFTTSRAPPPPPKAPTVSKITETSCLVEWTPVKPMGEDKISYQLQLLRGQREQEYRVIYRGEEPSFDLKGLDPRTEYSMRVGGIRECQTSGREGSESGSGGSTRLVGPVGPSVTFLTSGPEVILSNSEGKATALTTLRVTPRRPLTDQQKAVVLLLGFVVFGFFLAAFIQQVIAYSMK